MSQQRQGVLIAIDWENIRRGAQLYQRRVGPAHLCRAMTDVGGVFGEVKGGKVFGDWSLRPDDGREFAEQDIVPYHAPRTAAGKDRSEHECRRLVDEYQQAGIVERHDVANPNNPDWPTAAVRLVRSNETVRRALGFSDGPVSNPVLAHG